jgi:hypothetical protein
MEHQNQNIIESHQFVLSLRSVDNPINAQPQLG